MFVITRVSIPDVLLIFFLTLGPLKALGPFAQATRGADQAFCRSVARRATAIATAIVIGVALFSSVVLEQWRVSVAALVMSGSIILFCQSLRMVMETPVPAPALLQPQGVEPAQLSPTLAYFPVAVPTLVTAPGIAALVAFIAIARDDWGQTGIVLGILLTIMALNLVTLLNAEAILRRVPPPLLRVVGWVMAVLQAALAVQYLFNSLVRIGVLHPFSS
jgi:multiple antibiotic resistance protein